MESQSKDNRSPNLHPDDHSSADRKPTQQSPPVSAAVVSSHGTTPKLAVVQESLPMTAPGVATTSLPPGATTIDVIKPARSAVIKMQKPMTTTPPISYGSPSLPLHGLKSSSVHHPAGNILTPSNASTSQQKQSSVVFSSPASADVLRPLLSSSVKRQSVSLISRIRKSAAAVERKPDYDSAEFATEDIKIGAEDKDSSDSTRHLLSAIRSLPNPMSEKRQYRAELLKLAEVSDYEFLHFPIEAYYKKVKKGVPELIKTLQNEYNLWSSSFKVIEGHFGTGVVSYFVFLRWLLLLNIIMFIVTLIFLVLPQVIGTESIVKNVTAAPAEDVFSSDIFDRLPKESSAFSSLRLSSFSFQNSPRKAEVQSTSSEGIKLYSDLGDLLDTYAVEGFLDATLHHKNENFSRKTRILRSEYCAAIYEEMLNNYTKESLTKHIQDFFEGSGWMEHTVLFTGYYAPNITIFSGAEYDMSVAFLVVLFILVLVNIILMMSYASEGVQESMLEKLQEMYCYIVFCGWDFCIEESKAAKRQHNSIYQELISTLAEGRRKAKMKEWTASYKAKIFCIRMAAHLSTVLILVGAYYLIFYVASVQLYAERRGNASGASALLFQFLPSLTITGLNFLFPLVLAIITPFEEYKIGRQISVMLMRVVLLREASVIILVSSFYNQITCEPRDFCGKGYESCPSPMCWETYVGQQMYRLAVMDLFVHIAVTFAWETPRNYVVKKWNTKCTEMLGRPTFDIPTQVLSLVYSQTLSWLGMFYCPLLPAISVLKIIIFFYIKKFTVLSNCAPSQPAYKASRSNAIFVIVLLLSFFITVGILGYSVTQIEPSPGCSPFRYHDHMVHSLGEAMEEKSPELNKVVSFIFSPLVAYPIIILLCLTLYYYITKTWAHKKMVKLLKVQLTMESKDKQFLLERVTKMRPKTDGSPKTKTSGSSKAVWEKKNF